MAHCKNKTTSAHIANIVVAIVAGYYVIPAIDFWNTCHTTQPAFVRLASAHMDAIVVLPIVCAAVFFASLCAVGFSLFALATKPDTESRCCACGTVVTTIYTIVIIMTVIGFALGGYTPGVRFLVGCVV